MEIDEETLRQAAGLYRMLCTADAMYYACQDKSFRQFVRGCLKAHNVAEAYRRIAEAVGEEQR